MKAKHTPGPWISRQTYSDGEPFNMAVSSGARFVCEVEGGLTLEENEANARLIAAAPDLYDFASMVASLHSMTDLNTLKHMAEVALAKAKP